MSVNSDGGRRWPIGATILMLCAALVGVGGILFFTADIFKTVTSDPEPASGVSVTISSNLLDFGLIPMHGAVARKLILRNDGAEPVEASINTKGSIYSVSPERLTLQPGEPALVTVTAKPEEPGNLAGELFIQLGDAGSLVVALQGQAREGLLASNLAGSGRGAFEAGGIDGAPSAAENRRVRTSSDRGQFDSRSDPARSESAGRDSAGSESGDDAASKSGNREQGGSADSATGKERRRNNSKDDSDSARFGGVRVVDITEEPLPPPREISEAEKERARSLPEKTPDAEDLDELPEELPPDDEPFDRESDDLNPDDSDERGRREEEEDENDRFTQPLLAVSGASTVGLIGHFNYFYPQELGVIGADMGGPLTLVQPIQFPAIPVAFGETLRFAQMGGIAGSFDPSSGQVNLELTLAAIDGDGGTAPMALFLTTGTTYARNEAGIVVSMTGSPRMPDTGVLKLAGIQTIPLGYNHSAEGHMVTVEILAQLTFGTQASPGGRPGLW